MNKGLDALRRLTPCSTFGSNGSRDALKRRETNMDHTHSMINSSIKPLIKLELFLLATANTIPRSSLDLACECLMLPGF